MTDKAGTGAGERVGRYELLDYMRFIAALMVVLHHWLVNGITNGKVDTISGNDWAESWAKYGNLGVSLFFLISGFVITISTNNKTARQFTVSRFARLYPAFWIALIFTTVVTIVAGGDTFDVTETQFLANLTMVPGLLDQPLVDGAYWTLLYELQFYVLVLVVLFIGQGHRLVYLFPIWTTAMIAATLFAPDVTAGRTYAGGFYLLFAAGALIATIRDRGPSWWNVLPLIGAWAMSVRFAMIKADDALQSKGFDLDRHVSAVVVTAFFLIIASMCIPRVAALRLPFAQSLGALSYPMYLLHAHFGYMMLNEFANDSNKMWVYSILLVTLLALSWAIHWLVDEKPRVTWIKRITDRTLGALIELLQPSFFRRRQARDDAKLVSSSR